MIARAGLEAALAALAERRPVFHSEADFQFALAWALRELHPDVEVRLEYPTPWEARGYIDIWLRGGDGATAIELKYWKGRGTFEVNGERFDLSGEVGALEHHEFWKDVERTERLVDGGHAASGYVLALTNHQGYWNKRGGSQYDAFRLYDRRHVEGTLDWADWTAENTQRDNPPIALRGRYVARWAPYSEPRRGEPGGEFRSLLLDVSDGLEAGR